jgi:carboxypeptidase Taq
MKTHDAIGRLKAHLAPMVDVIRVIYLLEWDQQTYMPPGGGPDRAESVATLKRLAHEMFTDPRTGSLLEAAETAVTALNADSDDAALFRVTRRDYDRATRLPPNFVAEKAKAEALAVEAWRLARPANDFKAFLPHLVTVFGMARREADYLGYTDHPYDALLDEFEPLMTSREVAALFTQLREATVPLVRAIVDQGPVVNAKFLHGDYHPSSQEAFGKMVAEAFGYDFLRGRIDQAPHPFATTFGLGDVRITTRYDPRYLPSGIFSIFHEAGHGMYEQGISPSLDRTPLAGGCSLGFHESQSRMWENLVGRSRPFWRHFFPQAQKMFPQALKGVDAEGFYRAVNLVEPSLIRVEADEVTYNLHIILRFEIEMGLLDGSLQVSDLPEIWNARMEKYLGVRPPNNKDGVLQDIHWSNGGIGYFPTYTLGNVISAQLFEAASRARRGLMDEIGAGQFRTLLGWLRDSVHRHGRKFFPKELLRRATGQELSPEPYVRYLRAKFGEIYGISVEPPAPALPTR